MASLAACTGQAAAQKAAEQLEELRSWACFGVGNMVDFPGKTWKKTMEQKTIWEKNYGKKNYMEKSYRTMMISIRYEKNGGNIVIDII